MAVEQGRRGETAPTSATDILIAALEEAIELLKEDIGDRENASTEMAPVIRMGEAAIRAARQGERGNTVMAKPRVRRVSIGEWGVWKQLLVTL